MTDGHAARHGVRHGDVSSLAVNVRNAALARAFYGSLLGWTFDPGDPALRSAVAGVRPEMTLARSDRLLGVVLSYRVEDVTAAVGRARARGGSAADPVPGPHAVEADCLDDQGISFRLQQFPDGRVPGEDGGPAHGDVAYVTLAVPSLAAAQDFYGEVLGWTFSAGSGPDRSSIDGMTPMGWLAGDGDWIGARLAYRVDDLAGAMAAVGKLGGATGPVEQRPYGLVCEDCIDDQGAPFMLMQPVG